jgi:hypothetical protein
MMERYSHRMVDVDIIRLVAMKCDEVLGVSASIQHQRHLTSPDAECQFS